MVEKPNVCLVGVLFEWDGIAVADFYRSIVYLAFIKKISPSRAPATRFLLESPPLTLL